jgi:hypothetical protein
MEVASFMLQPLYPAYCIRGSLGPRAGLEAYLLPIPEIESMSLDRLVRSLLTVVTELS